MTCTGGLHHFLVGELTADGWPLPNARCLCGRVTWGQVRGLLPGQARRP